ncbi:hypothetical protein [Lysinibacillus sphaericus]|uniref:hypothetical protein n=1 Tax=Lysinibacillus sphaericus TaxID=1421 RepID=UPI000C18FC5A|nr:hypothetical protein [Lysinibacillus sphaericus]PIJ98164.1 hypothetical protein CTN02_10505 [Lysinibacillus sphaericus]
MIKILKEIFSPTLEEKLIRLSFNKDYLIKEINNGKIVFSDNETVVKFATLLTEQLSENYEVNGVLDSFELKVLNKVLEDNFYSISYLLLSDLEERCIDKQVIEEKMNSNGFQLLNHVGYINVDKVVTYIPLGDLE